MLKHIRKTLSPPLIDGEEMQRRALVLYGLSISIGLASLIGFIGVLIVFEEKAISGIALGILFGSAATAFFLSKTRYVLFASILLLTAIWMLTTSLVSISGGMRSLDIIFYITVTALAGLLLGQRGTYGYGAASIMAGVVFLILGNAGIALPSIFPFPQGTGFILLLINLAALIPAINITINTLSKTIEQAQARLEEQKRIQDELRISEEKFSKVFHASPMAILLQRRRDHKYTDVNEEFTRITGYSREEALEHGPNDLNLYPYKETVKQIREQMTEQGYIRNFEFPFRRKDGEIGYGLLWGDSLEISNEFVDIGGVIDITDRKQFEILQTEQAQEISALYEALAEITGATGNIKTVSQQIADIIVIKLHAYKCAVWLLSENKSELKRMEHSGPDIVESIEDISLNDPGLITYAIKHSENIYVPDVRDEPRYHAEDKNTQSEFVVVLKAHGEVIGVINMESPHLDGFNERTRRLVSAFVENAAIALQNANLVESLEATVADLQETQSQFDFFLKHTNEGVYRVDYDPPIPIDLPLEEQYKLSRQRGRFGECNDAIAQMYGYASRDEMLGKSYNEDAVHDEGYEDSLRVNLEFYRQGYRAYDSETEEYTTTGEKVYFLNNAVGIIRDGYFLSIWGTQRDITPLKQTIADLKETQSRINFFLEHTAEGVYRIDYDPPIPVDLPFEEQFRLSVEHGKIGECNEAFAKMYGLSSREEMLGTPYTEFYGEDGYEVNLETNLKFYQNGYKVDDVETEEYNTKGEKVYFANNVVGIIRDGYFVSTWGTQRDITPLRNAISELEQRNAELERVAYTLSHELRTPLVTIRGFLGYLEDSMEKGNITQAKSDLARIAQASDRMGRLIDELLNLSRVENLIRPYTDVHFETIVQEAITQIESELNRKNIKIIVNKDLPVIHGDRQRLVDVVQNLVDNAAKFLGEQPEPLIEIGVIERSEREDPVFFVRDNGMGIEAAYHKRVFMLFEKLDTKARGTGVGLTLVKRIIETHGGSIWLESDGLGQGTTIYFTLPKK